MRREFKYQNGPAVHTVTIEPDGDRLTVRVGESVFSIVARPVEQGRLDLEVDGRRLRAYAVQSGNKYYVAVEGQTWIFQRPDERARRKSGAGAGTGSLQAAMPGRVLDVLVAEGDVVAKGDTLVLLEAMKMELRITAPADGYVGKVLCVAGQVVERGQALVQIATEPVGTSVDHHHSVIDP